MAGVILAAAVCISVSQSIINKLYNRSNTAKGIYVFSAIRTLAAMLVFILVSKGQLDFTRDIFVYSLGFAVSYGTTTLCGVLAVRYGSLSLTTLLSSYSLMIPTMYGLLVLKEPAGIFLVLGIICLLLSIFFISFKKEEFKFSVQWLLMVVLSFLGNGMCSTVQKMQQIAFVGEYSSEFMILALGMLTVFFAAAGAILAPRESVDALKKSWGMGVVHGGANGVLNYFVILLNTMLPASVIFPVISGGSLLLVCILSRLIFKEKLAKMQLLGVGIGIMAIIFFNLK